MSWLHNCCNAYTHYTHIKKHCNEWAIEGNLNLFFFKTYVVTIVNSLCPVGKFSMSLTSVASVHFTRYIATLFDIYEVPMDVKPIVVSFQWFQPLECWKKEPIQISYFFVVRKPSNIFTRNADQTALRLLKSWGIT